MDAVDPTTLVAAEQTFRELQIYAVSFALACSAGLVRAIRDNRYRGIGDLVSAGLSSGFIALGCVALLCWVGGGSSGHEPGLVAVSVFLGLMGKEADKLYPRLFEWALRRFGVDLVDKEKTQNESPPMASRDDPDPGPRDGASGAG